MRSRLTLVFIAISTLLATVFIVPIGFLVRRDAEHQAIERARAEAVDVAVELERGDQEALSEVLREVEAGRDGRVSIVSLQEPGAAAAGEFTERHLLALSDGRSTEGPVLGGYELIDALVDPDGEITTVRVFIPESELRSGQWGALAMFVGLALVVIVASVAIADRLAQIIIRPTRVLAAAARRLGDGDLTASVEPDGPEELVELGTAFNNLGGRVATMLSRERELVAELSHRLRTPLTKLQMRVDHVENPTTRASLHDDVNDVTVALNGVIEQVRGMLAEERSSDAVELVRERVEFWSVLAEEQGRPWDFRSSVAAATVPLTEGELRAAIDVLIENVFKHTADGAAVLVECDVLGRELVISVADGGGGSDDTGPIVTRGVSGTGSTGLGLDIARRSAVSVGGRLEIGPSELGGAVVSLILPVRQRPPDRPRRRAGVAG